MQNNVIVRQYKCISTAREHKIKEVHILSQPNYAEKNNNTLVVLRKVHKLFSFLYFCSSYLHLDSSNKWKELITQIELILNMEQHQDLFPKATKRLLERVINICTFDLKTQT